MGNVIINDSLLYDIADAVREKTFTDKRLMLSEMPDAIKSIQGLPDIQLFHTYENVINLSRDTSFDSVTVNTTAAKTIRPTGTGNELDTILSEIIDMEEYDVLFVSENMIDVVYKKGDVIPRVLTQRNLCFNYIRIAEKYDGSFEQKGYVRGNNIPSFNMSSIYYLNNTGVFTQTGTNTYAFVLASLGPTTWTSNNPSGTSGTNNMNQRYLYRITCNPGLISVRAATAGPMSVDAFKDVDSEKTNIYRRFYLFKVPRSQKNIMKAFYDAVYLNTNVEDMFK